LTPFRTPFAHPSTHLFLRYIRDVLLLDLPIIALTAEIGIDARTAVLSAGANSLISKPAQAEDIIRMLDELIYLDF
jgi:CheY-like chemotaxis protein